MNQYLSKTKEHNNYDVVIDLDKAIYNPGDLINGKIKLILNKKLSCNFLSVKLNGIARVFFTEISVSFFIYLP